MTTTQRAMICWWSPWQCHEKDRRSARQPEIDFRLGLDLERHSKTLQTRSDRSYMNFARSSKRARTFNWIWLWYALCVLCVRVRVVDGTEDWVFERIQLNNRGYWLLTHRKRSLSVTYSGSGGRELWWLNPVNQNTS